MSADVIQQLTGHGAIYRGGERVAETDYELTITPLGAGTPAQPGDARTSPEMPGATAAGAAASPAPATITGRLLGHFFASESFADGVHTLQLADGRELDFRVLQPDTNEIVGVSWFH
jgi:hypothetical protein